MEKINIKPGIYENVSYDDYFKWQAINNSTLWRMKKRNPAYVQHMLESPPAESDALRVGSALHFQVLEPDEFKNHFVVAPKVDRRTKAGKADWIEFQESLRGRDFLKPEEMAMITGMHESVQQTEYYQYLTGGTAEVGIVWEDEETGILCKAKLDYVIQDNDTGMYVVSDLKSSAVDGSAGGFQGAGMDAPLGDLLSSTDTINRPPFILTVCRHSRAIPTRLCLWPSRRTPRICARRMTARICY